MPAKNWIAAVGKIAAKLESGVDRAKYSVLGRVGPNAPPRIFPYRGYGTTDSVRVLGRVLRDAPEAKSSADASAWQNFLATARRFETDEVPGARILLRAGNVSRQVVTDDEGYFDTTIEGATLAPLGEGWFSVEAELVHPSGAESPHALLPVLVPPATATFGIISDIDDTVVHTEATSVVAMARTVFFGNARTRLPFKGVAAFYRALRGGPSGSESNPLFYVSSSPWNLYDLLVEYFELQQIPLGPIALRDWGIRNEEIIPASHATHKRAAIDNILAMYPTLPFVLIGDSGQEDPEIYAQVIRDFPGRIRAAYIRSVVRSEQRVGAIRKLAEDLASTGATLLLADDTLTAAKHAAAQGWISEKTLPDIGLEAAADAGEPAAERTVAAKQGLEPQGSPPPSK